MAFLLTFNGFFKPTCRLPSYRHRKSTGSVSNDTKLLRTHMHGHFQRHQNVTKAKILGDSLNRIFGPRLQTKTCFFQLINKYFKSILNYWLIQLQLVRPILDARLKELMFVNNIYEMIPCKKSFSKYLVHVGFNTFEV